MFRRKKTVTYILSKPKPRFQVRTFPVGYGNFRVVITDRHKAEHFDRYASNRHIDKWNRETGREVSRDGFKTRGRALDFAHRIIKIRTRWEAYVTENTTTVDVDG